jgi:hypothetical protein
MIAVDIGVEAQRPQPGIKATLPIILHCAIATIGMRQGIVKAFWISIRYWCAVDAKESDARAATCCHSCGVEYCGRVSVI